MKTRVLDLGWYHPDYFPGCGVHGTDYDHVVLGCGDTLKEAVECALNDLACEIDVPVPDHLEEECAKLATRDPGRSRGDRQRYVAIQWRNS